MAGRKTIVTSVGLSPAAFEVAIRLPYGLRSQIFSDLLEEWGRTEA